MEESKAVTALAALAHATRMRVFRRLIEAGPGGLAAGTLAEATGTASSTLSAHLSKLEHAGLVEARRQSRQIFYAVRIEAIRQLMSYLIEDCCKGQPDLCGTGLTSLATIDCEECNNG